MTLTAEMDLIRGAFDGFKNILDHNAKLIDNNEGNLLEHLLKDLKEQMSLQSFDQCKHRVAPINVLNKIIEKISAIYLPAPTRRIVGTDSDQELFAWYQDQFQAGGVGLNSFMSETVKALNLCKSVAVQPFCHNLSPRLRVLRNDHMFVFSTDKVDPMSPTHLVTLDMLPNGETEYTAYTDQEFLIFNDKKEINHAEMAAMDNPAGINVYGVLPFVYQSLSRRRLMPLPDTDVLKMTKLIPLLFSDLNYAVMFQAFSIVYGIDIDDEAIARAPNAFWRFKSDPNSDKKPEIGSIKPEVDIEPTMALIQSQLAFWLNTKGIRPGAIGKLDKDNFASGISKIVDEMDTTQLKESMIETMTPFEMKLWDLIMHKLHPVWVQQGIIGTKTLFSPDAKLEIVFNVDPPAASRGDEVVDLQTERDAGFNSTRRCIQQLNPLMDDEEIDALIVEIDAEKAKNAPPPPPVVDPNAPPATGGAA